MPFLALSVWHVILLKIKNLIGFIKKSLLFASCPQAAEVLFYRSSSGPAGSTPCTRPPERVQPSLRTACCIVLRRTGAQDDLRGLSLKESLHRSN